MIYEVQTSGTDMDSAEHSPVWTTVFATESFNMARACAESIATAYPHVRVMPIKPCLVFDHGNEIVNVKRYTKELFTRARGT